MLRRILAAMCFSFVMMIATSAQDDTVLVPDLTGLNAPQAAALLNAVGLSLGDEGFTIWTEDSALAQGVIESQAIEPGTEVSPATAIDVNILRTPNMRLVYDDNDITLVNSSENVADVSGLRFVAVEGDNPAAFPAAQWASSLRSTQCMQLWSVPRNQSKSVDGCAFIQSWLSTNTTGLHFWTAANGVQQFAVVEDGIERTRCDAAPLNSQDAPLQCEFYFGGASAASDITAYIYLAYTSTTIAVINQSNDRWMPTDRTLIYNPQGVDPNAGAPIGNPSVFENPSAVADLTQLAPGQCVMMTTGHPNGTTPPQPCNVIAQQDLPPEWVFWQNDFEVESANDSLRRICPAATEGRVTLCIVPQ